MPSANTVAPARRLRRQHKAAHGFSGYTVAALDVLHFVARRRLPAVKRTAAIPGVSACKVKTVPPAALRIHSAATRPKPCRAPSSFLLHSAGRTQPKANPLRGIASQIQNRSALRVCWLESTRVLAALDCTPPGRGKSQAIQHNRALPKVGQSLRRASLGGLPLARPAGSGNGRLCLAPQPGQRLCRRRYRRVWLFRRFAQCGGVAPPAQRVCLRRLALRCSFPPRQPRPVRPAGAP